MPHKASPSCPDRKGSRVQRKRSQEWGPTVADMECSVAEELQPMRSDQVGPWGERDSQGFVLMDLPFL